jgi:hypothetical protein
MTNRRLAAVALALTLIACSSILGSSGRVEVGVIAWESGAESALDGLSVAPPHPGVQAPDTVAAGAPFTVVLTTIAPDGCWREAGVRIDRTAAVVELTPYDRWVGGPGKVCPDVVVHLSREVVLRFDTPGTGTLRIFGRRVRGGGFEDPEPIVIERSIVVR